MLGVLPKSSVHRNHRPPLLPAPSAPEPPFEVENLGRGAQSGPEQRLRRQQRDMVAGGAIDLDEVTLPEILDPCRVERQHISAVFLKCSKQPHGAGRINLNFAAGCSGGLGSLSPKGPKSGRPIDAGWAQD